MGNKRSKRKKINEVSSQPLWNTEDEINQTTDESTSSTPTISTWKTIIVLTRINYITKNPCLTIAILG